MKKRLVGYVWGCGDNYCDCSQAVLAVHQPWCRCDCGAGHLVGSHVWRGELYTDGEPGAREELDTLRAVFEAEWPGGVEWL